MQVNGITWHATVVEADTFDSMRTLATETMGLSPMMAFPGGAVFSLPGRHALRALHQGH